MPTNAPRTSFVKAYFTLIKETLPFLALLIVGGAGVMSSNWDVFFLKSLPFALKYGSLLWFVCCLRIAYERNINGVGAAGYAEGEESDFSIEDQPTNPATGLPVVGGIGSPDINGHSWGTSD